MSADLPEKLSPQPKRRSPSTGLSPEKRKRGRPRGATGKASGWLVARIETRKGKTYPKVQGDRVPKDLAFDYPHQFFWVYQYKEWCAPSGDSEAAHQNLWRTKAKRVRPEKAHLVRSLIASRRLVPEILNAINS